MVSETTIAEQAVVSKDTTLGERVEICPYAVIEGKVRIGNDVRIGPFCYIRENSTIDDECKIEAGAQISVLPKGVSLDEHTGTHIKARATIGEKSLVERASIAGRDTIVGENALVLPDVHIGHNSVVGAYAFLTNGVKLAGHVYVGDGAVLGGNVAVHQFVTIGKLAFVAGGMNVTKDVVPYAWFANRKNNPFVYGLNAIGIKRAKLSDDQIARIKNAYLMLRDGNGRADIVQRLAELKTQEAAEMQEFLKNANRGIYAVRGNRLINPTTLYSNVHAYESNIIK